MPRHDPAPTHPSTLKQRFLRIFRLLALFSVLIAAIAVVLVARGEGEWRLHMLVATGLGVGLTMLVGSALMALTFLSASSGHDDQAGESRHRSTEKDGSND